MVVVIGAALIGALGAYFLALGLDVATAETTARAEKAAEDALDREEAPFTAQVTYVDYKTYGRYLPVGAAIVLDRTLTADEQQRLTAIPLGENQDQQVWDLFKSLGGRMIETYDGDARTFRLSLFSDRTAALSITDMQAVVDRCHPSKAQTVVQLPSGDGVYWDLGRRSAVPVIAGSPEAEDYRLPYFPRRRIDLGGGQGPGALQVTSSVLGETCEWHIEARYEDSAGAHPAVRVSDGGRPLVTEAVPAQPRVYFSINLDKGWECAGAELKAVRCLRINMPRNP
ncbi:hypothetical protein ACWCQL_31720 [Streptomyces sp. NPDC002073]